MCFSKWHCEFSNSRKEPTGLFNTVARRRSSSDRMRHLTHPRERKHRNKRQLFFKRSSWNIFIPKSITFHLRGDMCISASVPKHKPTRTHIHQEILVLLLVFLNSSTEAISPASCLAHPKKYHSEIQTFLATQCKSSPLRQRDITSCCRDQ